MTIDNEKISTAARGINYQPDRQLQIQESLNDHYDDDDIMWSLAQFTRYYSPDSTIAGFNINFESFGFTILVDLHTDIASLFWLASDPEGRTVYIPLLEFSGREPVPGRAYAYAYYQRHWNITPLQIDGAELPD